jgi:hypothetical protein
MTEPQKMYNSQIEIDDLIDDAVKNAVVRRHEALDSEETLLSMSDEEAKNVAGGIKFPIILGIPIVTRLII